MNMLETNEKTGSCSREKEDTKKNPVGILELKSKIVKRKSIVDEFSSRMERGKNQ